MLAIYTSEDEAARRAKVANLSVLAGSFVKQETRRIVVDE
jgi:hypothetical protein